ncbi:MAG: trypsin-like peptidase domain-containing protein [Polyangiaceae bacterium]
MSSPTVKYLEQVLRPRPEPDNLDSLESLGDALEPFDAWRISYEDGATTEVELRAAYNALTDLRAGKPIEDTSALEAIVLPTERPVIDIVDDTFADLKGHWVALNDAKVGLRDAIRATGRVRTRATGRGYSGTGFLAGEMSSGPHQGKALLVTNRHVALDFCDGVGALGWDPVAPTEVDLKQEVDNAARRMLTVHQVALVHPHWDVAVLVVSSVDGAPLAERITLATSAPAANTTIAVVGYPYFTGTPTPELERRLFRGLHSKKRLMPGRLHGRSSVQPTDRRWPTMQAATHDASTLGGNSGSCVLDWSTPNITAVGVHFGGRYLEVNFAVPTWELARDPRLRDLGLRFSTGAAEAPDPIVEAAWVRATTKNKTTTTAPVEGGWFERVSRDALTRSVQFEESTHLSALDEALGRDLASHYFAALRAAPSTARDVPDIVVLHGLFGCHLDDRRGRAERVWLSPRGQSTGPLARRLTLEADGIEDAYDGQELAPNGVLRCLYEPAAAAWRALGHTVHFFAFDWRKSAVDAALRLDRFLEDLALGRPNRRIALVAHSTGGRVAALYAQRCPNWRQRIESCVFAGVPMGGSFAAVELLLGSHPICEKLRQLDPTYDDLGAAFSSFPSLFELLPDPAVFPEAADVYDVRAYPRASDDRSRGRLSRWLRHSHNLHAEVRQSPILERTEFIYSNSRATPASAQPSSAGFSVDAGANGDDLVLERSALPDGRYGVEVDMPHLLLPLSPEFWRIVPELLERSFATGSGLEPYLGDDRRSAPEVTPLSDSQLAALRARDPLEPAVLRWWMTRDAVLDAP